MNTIIASKIVHGHWRLKDWKLSDQETLTLTNQCLELGITTFDHADIYGDYECEKLFGNVLALDKSLRDKIQIISKCGIKLLSDKFPERNIKTYDYSSEQIIQSVENSLKNFSTDRIDLLLIHRPAPFFNPEEVAQVFSALKSSGKVLHFGVSNFNPLQTEMLNSYLDEPLVTNQVEISPFCLEHFENGNMDSFLKNRMKPMSWSPLGRGVFAEPRTKEEKLITNCLLEIAAELEIGIDQVLLAWILKHPAGIIPVIGSGKHWANRKGCPSARFGDVYGAMVSDLHCCSRSGPTLKSV